MLTKGTKENNTQTMPSPWLEAGASNLPHAKLVAKVIGENAKEGKEPLGRLQMLKINTDRRQRAFHDGPTPGGLPVDNGAAVDEYTEATERKSDWGGNVDTIDWHDINNLSLAVNYGADPFSSLTLKDGIVMFNDLAGNSIPYAEKIKRREEMSPPEEVVRAYLTKKRIFRTFLALMFDNQVSGLEQTLWPKHATIQEEELGYLERLKEKGEMPDMVVYKGGEAQRRLDGSSDWKPDSYSAIIDATGAIVETVSRDGRTIAKGEAGKEIRALIEEKNLTGVVLDGIAFTHCVKDTAEGLRLMQKMHELIESRGKDLAQLKSKFTQRQNEPEFSGVEWKDIDNLIDYYVIFDMTLDPGYTISVNVEKTAPVQLPGPGMETINQQLVDSAEQAFRSMGVRLITDKDLK